MLAPDINSCILLVSKLVSDNSHNNATADTVFSTLTQLSEEQKKTLLLIMMLTIMETVMIQMSHTYGEYFRNRFEFCAFLMRKSAEEALQAVGESARGSGAIACNAESLGWRVVPRDSASAHVPEPARDRETPTAKREQSSHPSDDEWQEFMVEMDTALRDGHGQRDRGEEGVHGGDGHSERGRQRKQVRVPKVSVDRHSDTEYVCSHPRFYSWSAVREPEVRLEDQASHIGRSAKRARHVWSV